MPKRYTISAIVILIAATIAWNWYMGTVNGSTKESRGQILSQKVAGAHIITEIKVENYIISGIISDSNEYGLAVFRSKSGGYVYEGKTMCKPGKAITCNVKIDKTNYDLFWYNRGDLDYAEITYSYGGKKEIKSVDAKDNRIICLESPSVGYTVTAVYYDVFGNICE